MQIDPHQRPLVQESALRPCPAFSVLFDSVRLLAPPRVGTREEILKGTPCFWRLDDLASAVARATRANPLEMHVLDVLGVHPTSSGPMINYFRKEPSEHSGSRRNIGLHSLGVAEVVESLGERLLAPDERADARSLALLHDALKRIDIMQAEAVEAGELAGAAANDRENLCRVLEKYGIGSEQASRLIEIRDLVDSRNFITRFLSAQPGGQVRLAEGGLGDKIIMLADYLNCTSGPGEEPIWSRNVTPSEKPIVARWGDIYRGINATGYALNRSSGRVEYVPNLGTCAPEFVIGNHLTVQEYVGNAICDELFCKLDLTGSDPGYAIKEFVNRRR